ncbi:putative O-glycosylation ligase, exosortase A system-associated [Acidihalobacter yilgarnensis]|uniref:Putative O-glycosylation ligase, exosortase A system-associated n=1 Tax=Acidihalobacter yilgarnensis TaxID=2819280 RepID=A0A1D8IPV3_9GAMM|nr:putative O-glycosylation ligase, exosortase A system-associated [Acidihalobacter yilgarnensis]AOU98520.1 putative O-glycosylation ligase, exosortase A system-associated [Acidihalobacter yilgarnensis]
MRALVFMLFMAGTIPMALAEPYIGLLVWVLLSDMNIYREVYGFASDFRWVLIISIVTIFSMLINRHSVKRIEWSALSITMVLFAIMTSISTAFAMVPWFATPHWIQFLKIMAVVFAIMMLVNTPSRLHGLIWIFVISFGFWSAKGGFFTLIHGGNYHVYGPSPSFFGDNNQFALVMCMTLPLMRYLQIHAQSRWLRWGLWGLVLLTIVSILGTYSRGGLIGLAVVLPMLILKSRKRVSVILSILIVLPLVFNFMPQAWVNRMRGLDTGSATQSQSFQGRLQSWEFATNVALHRPVTGGGFGVWASRQVWAEYGPPEFNHALAIHSIWFEVLAEQGFVGLGLYIGMLALAWRNLVLIRKRSRDQTSARWLFDLAGYLQVSLVGFVVTGSALPQAYFNFTFQLLAVIVVMRSMLKIESIKLAVP